MCMLTGPAHVSKTTQLAICLPPWDGIHRIVGMYGNKVQLEGGKPAAMILQVPTKKPENIRLYNEKECNAIATCFKDLSDVFKSELSNGRASFGFGGSRSHSSTSSSSLPVFRVGSYEVTVVPAFKDFNRLNTTVFALDDTLFGILEADSKLYSYAYIVAILRVDAVYHPLAYMFEVDGLNGFIPTKHYHMARSNMTIATGFSGVWHPKADDPNRVLPSGAASPDSILFANDWDHEIIIVGAPHFKTPGAFSFVFNHIEAVKLNQTVAPVVAQLNQIIPGVESVKDAAFRMEISGVWPNIDLTFPLVAPAHRGAFCDSCKRVIVEGARYKCISCTDVDLCANCHSKNARTGNKYHDGLAGHPYAELKDQADADALTMGMTHSDKALMDTRLLECERKLSQIKGVIMSDV